MPVAVRTQVVKGFPDRVLQKGGSVLRTKSRDSVGSLELSRSDFVRDQRTDGLLLGAVAQLKGKPTLSRVG